jgi:hypothetical protein
MHVPADDQRVYRQAIDCYKRHHHLTTYSLQDALSWALDQGHLEVPPDVGLRYHLPRASESLRKDQIRTRVDGRICRFRRRHCMRTVDTDPTTGDPVQRELWGDIEDAPWEFLQESIRQRLDALLADYRSIHADVVGIAEYWASLPPDDPRYDPRFGERLTQMLFQYRHRLGGEEDGQQEEAS